MSPNRRYVKIENSTELDYYTQCNPFKLEADLLNISILSGNHYEARFPYPVPNHINRSCSQNRDDLQLTLRRNAINSSRPRLTYSRWNMMISSRYKTELCRQFDEEGICHFEDKCLFAHGRNELRPLPRHPKYKTELCRDFHETGFCSFGPRCNFIHSSFELIKSVPEPNPGTINLSQLGLSINAEPYTPRYQPSISPSVESEVEDLRSSDSPYLSSPNAGTPTMGLFGAVGEPLKNSTGGNKNVDDDFKDLRSVYQGFF